MDIEKLDPLLQAIVAIVIALLSGIAAWIAKRFKASLPQSDESEQIKKLQEQLAAAELRDHLERQKDSILREVREREDAHDREHHELKKLVYELRDRVIVLEQSRSRR